MNLKPNTLGLDDWLGIGGFLLNAGQFIGNLVAADQAQKESDKNYQTQKEIAEKNLQFEQEKFQYDKDLQNTIFQREDNTIQRNAADLEAAGFNRVLAAGGTGSGAGSIVATNAPQQATPQKDYSQTLSAKISAYQALGEMSRNLAEARNLSSQSKYNDELAREKKWQADQAQTKAEIEVESKMSQIEKRQHDAAKAKIEAMDAEDKRKFHQELGLPPHIDDPYSHEAYEWYRLHPDKAPPGIKIRSFAYSYAKFVTDMGKFIIGFALGRGKK